MTSRQFRRPGRKMLRGTHALRAPRTSHAWRNAFLSFCAVATAIYTVAAHIAR
jgi:hypothetical protein